MVVWGGTPIFTKVAAAEIDPLLVGILRTALAGVAALPLVAVMRQPLPVDRRGRGLLAFSGFAAFVGFPLIFAVGQRDTTAMHGALILATLPVFTSLFGTLIERRHVTPVWVAGCAIALAGEAVVILSRAGSAATGATSIRGDAIVLLSSLVCSMGYVAGARLTQRGYPSLATTLWGVAGSAVLLVPALAWSLAANGWPSAGPAAWTSVAILAFLTSILGYIAWYWALGHGGIARVAGVQFTQPLFGLALAALVLAERPMPVTAVAAVAILGGAWLVQQSAPAA